MRIYVKALLSQRILRGFGSLEQFFFSLKKGHIYLIKFYNTTLRYEYKICMVAHVRCRVMLSLVEHKTKVTWAISIWINFYHYMEPCWPIQSYLELFGPNLVFSGLFWYGLVSYFTYLTHFELFENTWDILKHL